MPNTIQILYQNISIEFWTHHFDEHFNCEVGVDNVVQYLEKDWNKQHVLTSRYGAAPYTVESIFAVEANLFLFSDSGTKFFCQGAHFSCLEADSVSPYAFFKLSKNFPPSTAHYAGVCSSCIIINFLSSLRNISLISGPAHSPLCTQAHHSCVNFFPFLS